MKKRDVVSLRAAEDAVAIYGVFKKVFVESKRQVGSRKVVSAPRTVSVDLPVVADVRSVYLAWAILNDVVLRDMGPDVVATLMEIAKAMRTPVPGEPTGLSPKV